MPTTPGYISLPYDSIIAHYVVKSKTSEETANGYTNQIVLEPATGDTESSFVGNMLLSNLTKEAFDSVEYNNEIYVTISSQLLKVEPIA